MRMFVVNVLLSFMNMNHNFSHFDLNVYVKVFTTMKMAI